MYTNQVFWNDCVLYFFKNLCTVDFLPQFFTTQSLTGKCNPLKVIFLEKPKIPEQNDCHLCEHFSVAQLQSTAT